MSKNHSENLTKRLVLIKYLFFIGEEQSHQLGAAASFSILAFHDCVEMLLVLIAHHEKKRTQKFFLEYWNEIPDLPYRGEMDNLNNVRVSLKHNATFPSRDEISRCHDDVRLFLSDSIYKYFETDFDDISISNLIMFDEVKKYIREAEMLMKEDSIYEILLKCKMAFIRLLSLYESDKQQWYNSIFNIGKEISTEYMSLVPRMDAHKSRWFEQVTQTLNATRDVLKISAIGIDYKKYVLFNLITPFVIKVCAPTDTEYKYQNETKEHFESTKKTTKQDCQFCIDFVIDSALKLQEFNFDIKNYLQ